jgi:hypothetical protein
MKGHLRPNQTASQACNNSADADPAGHPGLTISLQAVLAKEYAMKKGRAVLEIRYAILQSTRRHTGNVML